MIREHEPGPQVPESRPVQSIQYCPAVGLCRLGKGAAGAWGASQGTWRHGRAALFIWGYESRAGRPLLARRRSELYKPAVPLLPAKQLVLLLFLSQADLYHGWRAGGPVSLLSFTHLFSVITC